MSTSHVLRFVPLLLLLFAACERDGGDAASTTQKTPPVVRQLHFGTYHACALDDENKVWCSGDNDEGQLGDGTTSHRSSLTPVAHLGAMSGLAVGLFNTTCAWDAAGQVFCWGTNDRGLLATDNLNKSALPVAIEDLPPVTHVTLGAFHACALTKDHQVYCWGDNRAGQSAGGDATQSLSTPTLVDSLPELRDVQAGAEHTCAVTISGSLYCWGNNENGQLGLGSTSIRRTTRPAPVGLVPGDTKALATGFHHTCATFGERRRLYCWGANDYGQLGLDDLSPRFAPVEIPEIAYVDELATAAAQVCARIDDDVFCAGEPLRPVEEVQQSGQGFIFRQSPALERTTQMWSGALAICGVVDDGTLACRGIDQSRMVNVNP